MGLFILVAVTPAIEVNLRVVVVLVVTAMATIALMVAIARTIMVIIGMTPRKQWGATRDEVYPPHAGRVPLPAVFTVVVTIADTLELMVEVVAAVMVVVTIMVTVAAAVVVIYLRSQAWSPGNAWSRSWSLRQMLSQRSSEQ